ncbi:MAG: hypothetical protein LBH00_12410 [Planctomycetaceae bacterium]|nr:hypothetical protein [Planctomycetaceae bacterium]
MRFRGRVARLYHFGGAAARRPDTHQHTTGTGLHRENENPQQVYHFNPKLLSWRQRF